MAYTVTETFNLQANRAIGDRKYTREWRVVSDDQIVHPTLAIPQAPVVLGDLFPYDLDAGVKSISAKYQVGDDSRKVVIVSASYETGSGGQEEEDPLQEHPDIRWSARTVRLPVRYANKKIKRINGQEEIIEQGDRILVANSAGQKFDPPLEDDFKVIVYEFSHNIAVQDPQRTLNYRGAINNDRFNLGGLQVEPYQAMIARIEHQNMERNGERYWRESIVVEIGDDWRLAAEDMGILQLGDPEGPGDTIYIGGERVTVRPIIDGQGVPLNDPVPLNGEGQALDGADPAIIIFETVAHPIRPFKGLGLPTNSNP